jgi:magnesium chelatase family protein
VSSTSAAEQGPAIVGAHGPRRGVARKSGDMFATVPSATVHGVDAEPVSIEVHVSRGLPSFTIVGLPDAAVREARERVRAALISSGFDLPRARVLVHLAPADLRKEGPGLDLGIAVAVLAADGRIPADRASRTTCIGELALDGSVRPVRGALCIGWRELQRERPSMIVPVDDAPAITALGGVAVMPVATLSEAVTALRSTAPWPPAARCEPPPFEADPPVGPDVASLRGLRLAKRALEIAAAGRHSMLLTGPPGAGKTMLASCLPGLLPPLTRDMSLEVSAIHASAGMPLAHGLIKRPPFRSPHPSTPRTVLLGGGARPRPGDVSLAHHGVLLLDEMPEFPRGTLESLRGPIEEGAITVDRSRQRVRFPASFQLVGTRNPCPCGHAGSPTTPCSCSPAARRAYAARISEPLLDRIDLHLFVDVDDDVIAIDDAPRGPSSATLQARVTRARAFAARHGRSTAVPSSIDALETTIGDRGAWTSAARELAHRWAWSGRSYLRAARVARTIADLDARASMEASDLAEASTFGRNACMPL